MVAAKDAPAERERLVGINTRLLGLVASHDSIEADPQKLAAAADVYRDLLSSVSDSGPAAAMEAYIPNPHLQTLAVAVGYLPVCLLQELLGRPQNPTQSYKLHA